MQKPSLGRVVLYLNRSTGPDGQTEIAVPQTALVVGVHSDTCVSLVTWNEWGTATSLRSISEGTEAGRWMWPPRV